MNIEHLESVVWQAINMLNDSAIDGRAKWITGHKAENPDGTWTIAFRSRLIGKTAQFKVSTKQEASWVCKRMRELTR